MPDENLELFNDDDWSDGMSRAEVAKVLGVTTQRVAQIERKALAKLKRALTARSYRRDPTDYKPD